MTQQSSSVVIEFKPAGMPPTTAEGWCARLHADDVSEQDRQAFETWLKASADHRAQYELSALAFGLARGLADAPDLCAAVLGKRKGRPRKWLTAAAALLAVCATGLFVLHLSRSNYSTDVGEQKLISLADGTTVQLNTASAIQIDLNAQQRQVRLSRGEAFFNVTHDPSRPFVVKAGTEEIRVLGTKFNVRLDGDRTSVTLLEGRVRVDGVDLYPGQGADVSGSAVVKVPKVSAARRTSWREGKIYFEQDPLSEVLQEVNRYSETSFVLERSEAAALRLSGVFRTGDVDAVAFALRETYGLKTERESGRILIR